MWFVHLVMLFSVVSLCVMVYNYHTRPRVSNYLWYAHGYQDHDDYVNSINRGRSATGKNWVPHQEKEGSNA